MAVPWLRLFATEFEISEGEKKTKKKLQISRYLLYGLWDYNSVKVKMNDQVENNGVGRVLHSVFIVTLHQVTSSREEAHTGEPTTTNILFTELWNGLT